MPENWGWRKAAITDMQMRHVMLLVPGCKIHEGWRCVENDARVRRCCWSSSVAHQNRFVSQCVKPPRSPPAWIMQPPPDWQQTPPNGRLFHPQREADSLRKNNWKEPRSILMSSVEELPISTTYNYCEQYTPAQREYKCSKVIKLTIHLRNVCWVSVLTTFSAPPQPAASTVFFAQFQKRRNDVVWFLVLLPPVCFEQ